MYHLEKLDKFTVEIIVFIVFSIGYYFVQRVNNLKLTLQYLLYSYGVIILLLSITIPHIFPGYPYDISDLENKKRLVYNLQESNKALAETIETIRLMALLTFGVLLAVISKIIKHFKLEETSM